VNDRLFEIEIPANSCVQLELNFAPTEVASYDFDLSILINKSTESRFSDSQLATSMTPCQSELNTSLNRDKTPVTRKSSRSSAVANDTTLKKKVSAVGLRHALLLSSPKIDFKIPIKYFETLKDGGFYEAKVNFHFSWPH
jgi:hypothetical protein